MKKLIYYFSIATLSAGSILMGCESKEKKVEDAKEDVKEAQRELKEAEKELNAEYPAFKAEVEIKIAENDKRIIELRATLNKPGKLQLDEKHKKRIDELELQNSKLRSRLSDYEKERSDWEKFKREFNHDLKGIGEAFNDLGKKNTH